MVPITRVPESSNDTGVPLTVIAGAPGRTVCFMLAVVSVLSDVIGDVLNVAKDVDVVEIPNFVSWLDVNAVEIPD